jgi:hypothetical protein
LGCFLKLIEEANSKDILYVLASQGILKPTYLFSGMSLIDFKTRYSVEEPTVTRFYLKQETYTKE